MIKKVVGQILMAIGICIGWFGVLVTFDPGFAIILTAIGLIWGGYRLIRK